MSSDDESEWPASALYSSIDAMKTRIARLKLSIKHPAKKPSPAINAKSERRASAEAKRAACKRAK